jgi:membrane protein DedA with SNARE-associated domain
MEALAEDAMRWLLGYLVLGLASLIEYVFPPFPGDTVALFGVFLAATARWSALWVYLALDVGAIVGGLAAYAFGRSISRPEHRPRFLRGARTEEAIRTITERYAKHGAAYLAINRFVPALRAFFFIGAGIAKLRWTSVVLWGGLSAAVWNAILLAVGWWVGSEWDRLRGLMSTYASVVLALVVVAIAVALGRALWARRQQRT